ncbi:MAG: cysteine rich repeat-containing protein [Pikeienuella sp.]
MFRIFVYAAMAAVCIAGVLSLVLDAAAQPAPQGPPQTAPQEEAAPPQRQWMQGRGLGASEGQSRGRRLMRATARACRGDAVRFCESVPPGGGRVLACLMENRAALRPACAERVVQMSALREARLACYADQQRLCLGVEPGGGRIVRCLERNDTAISRECREAMAGAKAVFGR